MRFRLAQGFHSWRRGSYSTAAKPIASRRTPPSSPSCVPKTPKTNAFPPPSQFTGAPPPSACCQVFNQLPRRRTSRRSPCTSRGGASSGPEDQRAHLRSDLSAQIDHGCANGSRSAQPASQGVRVSPRASAPCPWKIGIYRHGALSVGGGGLPQPTLLPPPPSLDCL